MPTRETRSNLDAGNKDPQQSARDYFYTWGSLMPWLEQCIQHFQQQCLTSRTRSLYPDMRHFKSTYTSIMDRWLFKSSTSPYPAPLGAGGVDSIPANSGAQNVPSFRRWRFEMKLSPFFFVFSGLCVVFSETRGGSIQFLLDCTESIPPNRESAVERFVNPPFSGPDKRPTFVLP